MRAAFAVLAALIGPMPEPSRAFAPELPPGTVQTARENRGSDTLSVPLDRLSDGQLPMIAAEGLVSAQAWRIDGTAMSTLELFNRLRDQLEAGGYRVVMSCETDGCGGFDFRYRLELFPEPEMHVDLGDFRYLTASREVPGAGEEYVSLIVSRSSQTAFVQLNRVDPSGARQADIVTSTRSDGSGFGRALPEGKRGLGEQLLEIGRAPLDDLAFAVGSDRLEDRSFASLAELAAWLRANPGRKIALVGHTDAQGSLEANIALSRRRAEAVRQRLIEAHGIAAERIETEGVGYLMPIASNLTEEGRARNRRVEAVLTSTR